jgi:hypothetical protein
MKIIVLLILSITLIKSSYANDAILVKKDEVVPFDGILLTKERAEDAMKAEKKVIVLQDLQLTQKQLIEYYKKDAQLQRDKLSQAKFKDSMYNTGYFVLGVFLASFAFKIQNEVNR